MTEDGLNNNIDSILKLFDKDIEIWETTIRETHADNTDILIDKMISFGLVKISQVQLGRKFLTLEKLGHEVKRHGSWTKYLSDEKELKELAKQQVESTITTNSITRKILYVTIIIAAISAVISWLDYSKPSESYRNNEDSSKANAAKSDFERYLSTLPKIDLPTNLELSTDGKPYEYGEFEKFKTKWSDKPFGILYETSDKVVTVDITIASILVPVLVVYDRQGNILDALNAFKKTEMELDFETFESLYVDDKEIKVYSATTTWKLNDKKTDRIAGSETITRDTVVYTIDDKGKFRVKV